MLVDHGRSANSKLVFVIQTKKNEWQGTEDSIRASRLPPAPPFSSPPRSRSCSPDQPVEEEIEVPVQSCSPFVVPTTRKELMLHPLAHLVSARSAEPVTWGFLSSCGVTAEDLLFNWKWEEDLTPAVLGRLGVTWQDLLKAGLRREHVVARMVRRKHCTVRRGRY
jgi:hypothetical protein